MAGHPNRFRTGDVRIVLDDGWRHARSRSDRPAATVLSLPVLRRYGYPVAVGRDRAGAGR